VNRVSIHLLLGLLFALSCSPIRAQQSTPVGNELKSAEEKESTARLTADGVPLCSEQLKSWSSLPKGVYRVGGKVLPPTPTKTPDPTFTDEARKYARNLMKTQHLKRFEAKSLVGATVDTDGVPQNLCVFKELGYGLDRRAYDAVSTWRFHPATLDGNPVPVRLTVELTYALW
jgi:hypothetical protein